MGMKKLIVLTFVLLMGCDSSQSSMEKYFSNCVDDNLKVKQLDRTQRNIWIASSECQSYLKFIGNVDTFKYFKGKIWSAGYGK